MSASGAYNKIKDCATRNQDQNIKEQATQGARFFDIDTRMFRNKVDTCHGVAHEVEVKQVTNIFRKIFQFFFFFLVDNFFCHTPVLDLWWYGPWVSKPGWIPCLCASSPSCNGFLRFIYGVTPTNLLMACMAAKSFSSIYIGGTWTQTKCAVSDVTHALQSEQC